MAPSSRSRLASTIRAFHEDHVARERRSIARSIHDEGARIATRALAYFDARDIRKARSIALGRTRRMKAQRGPLARRYTPQFEALIRRFRRAYRTARHARTR